MTKAEKARFSDLCESKGIDPIAAMYVLKMLVSHAKNLATRGKITEVNDDAMKMIGTQFTDDMETFVGKGTGWNGSEIAGDMKPLMAAKLYEIFTTSQK